MEKKATKWKDIHVSQANFSKSTKHSNSLHLPLSLCLFMFSKWEFGSDLVKLDLNFMADFSVATNLPTECTWVQVLSTGAQCKGLYGFFFVFQIINSVILMLMSVLLLNFLVYEGNQVLWHHRTGTALKEIWTWKVLGQNQKPLCLVLDVYIWQNITKT